MPNSSVYPSSTYEQQSAADANNPLQKPDEDRSPKEKIEMATKKVTEVDLNKQWHKGKKEWSGGGGQGQGVVQGEEGVKVNVPLHSNFCVLVGR